MRKPTAIGFVILLTIALAACSSGQPGHPASGAPGAEPAWAASAGNEVNRALDKASTELATQDITLSDHDTVGKPLPGAKITPKGDLVIQGKPVALTPAQRAAVLAYRAQLIDVAQQGIVIGGQGAKLGITAAGDALAAIFSGASRQEIQQRVEARASGIKAAAAKLCNALPPLRETQQRLAVEVPEFAPYATLSQEDVKRCEVDTPSVHVTGH